MPDLPDYIRNRPITYTPNPATRDFITIAQAERERICADQTPMPADAWNTITTLGPNIGWEYVNGIHQPRPT